MLVYPASDLSCSGFPTPVIVYYIDFFFWNCCIPTLKPHEVSTGNDIQLYIKKIKDATLYQYNPFYNPDCPVGLRGIRIPAGKCSFW